MVHKNCALSELLADGINGNKYIKNGIKPNIINVIIYNNNMSFTNQINQSNVIF